MWTAQEESVDCSGVKVYSGPWHWLNQSDLMRATSKVLMISESYSGL